MAETDLLADYYPEPDPDPEMTTDTLRAAVTWMEIDEAVDRAPTYGLDSWDF